MKKLHELVLAAFAVSIFLTGIANAQISTTNEFATQTPGRTVMGVVEMCVNSSGVAVPKDAAGANCPGTSSGGVTPSATATPLANSASGTTAAVAASLPATSAKTNYVCGFDVSAVGGTTQFAVTLSNLKGPSGVVTFTYQMSASAGGAFLTRTFTPCIPANAANLAITATTGAAAGATAVNVNISGYQQ